MSLTSRVLSSFIALVALLALVPTSSADAQAAPADPDGDGLAGTLADADDFTDTAGPLAPGEIEVAAISTRAATVTGGDVLLAIRGTAGGETITVTADGVSLDAEVSFDTDGEGRALITGLPEQKDAGVTTPVTVTVTDATYGTRTATLPITNHPITGPVFSGPHQEPFTCQTERAGLGAPLDEDCSIETTYQWWYLSTGDLASQTIPVDWRVLEDPYGGYPADVTMTTTLDGDVVPAVVRVETSTINRGITRIAVLDDPVARGPEAPFETDDAWIERVMYQWGASCGIGFDQGRNTPYEVLSGFVDAGGSAIDTGPEAFRPPVLQGYITAHSSMTTFNTHCNQVLSAETMMMVREHLIEAYGEFVWVMGNGASGGAIQQYTAMNGYPGLQDGGLPLVSFPDVVTTAMSPADCRLLNDIFDRWPDTWTETKRIAVAGHDFTVQCEDWDASFADLLVADRGCRTAHAQVRDSDGNVVSQRMPCTLMENLKTFMGTDPETGLARRPLDNTGVQYGLVALENGDITPEEFVALNALVGGFDDDGNTPLDDTVNRERLELEPPTPDMLVERLVPPAADGPMPLDVVNERMVMDADLAADLFEHGFIVGRGAIDQAPIIDVNLYADPVPVLGFHDQVRGYMQAERIERFFGERETMSIWSGAVLTNDAWPVMAEWLDAVEVARAEAGGVPPADSTNGWSDIVGSVRPAQGGDSCVVTTAGYSPVPAAVPLIAGEADGPCEQVFGVGGSPRIAAGGPMSEDVIKCQTTSLDRGSYSVEFTDEQWAAMEATFGETGVCDWSLPSVGYTDVSRTWLSWGTSAAEAADGPEEIPHLVARAS